MYIVYKVPYETTEKWKKLRKKFQKNFNVIYEEKGESKKGEHFKVFWNCFAYHMLNDVDIIKIYEEKRELAYLFVVDIFKENIYFYVYEQGKEIALFEQSHEGNLSFVLSGRVLPEDYLYISELKKAVFDKKEFIQKILIFLLLIAGIFVGNLAYDEWKKSVEKKKRIMLETTTQTQQQPQITLTNEELYNLHSYIKNYLMSERAYQIYMKKLEEIKDKNGKIRNFECKLNLSEDIQQIRQGYTCKIVLSFSYPVLNSRLEGNEYIIEEVINEDFDGKQIRRVEEKGDFIECLNKLSDLGLVIQERTNDRIIFTEGWRFSGINEKDKNLFFVLLKNLYNYCGNKINITEFGIRKDELYINFNQLVR